ncbi:MAG: hypothetical protein R3F34_12260 [Planctomycetota bacterium]
MLDDPGPDAPAFASVLFMCMSIGFQGELMGERIELDHARACSTSRVSSAVIGSQLTPDAYGRNSPLTTVKLPTIGVLRLAAIGLGAVVFALVAGRAATSIKNSDVTSRIGKTVERLEETKR